MSGAWTPGPWHIVSHGDGDSLVICDDEEAMWRICFMATPGSAGSWDKIKANAHLIAASPDMFSVLEAVGYWPSVRAAIGDKLCAQLDAALAKARGDTPSPFAGTTFETRAERAEREAGGAR